MTAAYVWAYAKDLRKEERVVSTLLDLEIRKENALIGVLHRSIPVEERGGLEEQLKVGDLSARLGFFLCLMYGTHLVYIGESRMQLLFWATVGGFGVWWFLEAITISQRIELQNLQARRILIQAFIHDRLDRDSGFSTQTVVLERFQPSI